MATRKVKRYDDGGEVDPLESANKSSESQEIAGEAILKGMRDTEAAKPSNFREAFAAARKSGDKTFEFGGKKFTTELAGEKKAAAKSADDTYNPAVKQRLKDDQYNPDVKQGAKKGQSMTLQDRARSYADERAKSGVGMYGTMSAAAKKAKEETDEETRRLRNRVPPSGRGVIDTSRTRPNTLLPMKKGGMVGSASKRADGIAQRGKTRGKVC